VSIALTLPTVGASRDSWGTTVNAALNQLNAYIVGAYKTGDESVTSSTVLQNDDHLVLAVAASCVYVIQWGLRIDGAAAGDFKYSFTGPSGATMTWESQSLATGDTTNVATAITDASTIGTVVSHGTIASGTTSRVRGSGLLVVSLTAGSLQLQWAQATSSGTASKALTGSWIKAERIA
jgi:hypothetical protein